MNMLSLIVKIVIPVLVVRAIECLTGRASDVETSELLMIAEDEHAD